MYSILKDMIIQDLILCHIHLKVKFGQSVNYKNSNFERVNFSHPSSISSVVQSFVANEKWV